MVCNSLSKYNYNINIYNCDNKLICKSCSDELFFYAEYYKIYKIVIYTYNDIYPQKICKDIVLTPINCNIIIFNFNKLDNNSKIIPIILNITDKYYKGLKIMKGEINLWQNHIK